jgi:hypothetical protein
MEAMTIKTTRLARGRPTPVVTGTTKDHYETYALETDPFPGLGSSYLSGQVAIRSHVRRRTCHQCRIAPTTNT